MIISPKDLEPDTLRFILEDIVTRDGTDYGEIELTMDQKVERLKGLLDRKEVYLIFDEESETLSCISKDDAVSIT